jgi:hypothetical protein
MVYLDNFSIEDLFAQTDLSQDIPFDFTLNDPLVPSDTMSPQSSKCSSDNFRIEDCFSQTDLSQGIPFYFTSNDLLVPSDSEDCGLIVSDGTEHNESSSYNKSSVLILIPSISIS